MKDAKTLDKRTYFKMTRGQDRTPLSTLKGEEFTPTAYCLYEYTNSDGQDVNGLSLLINGDVYITSSEPMINSFETILSVFGEDDDDVTLTIVSKTSKAGREYNVLDVVI